MKLIFIILSYIFCQSISGQPAILGDPIMQGKMDRYMLFHQDPASLSFSTFRSCEFLLVKRAALIVIVTHYAFG
jgi:hypothetical protein